MSAEDRAKAAGKNIEGKAQEAWGNVTGDPKDQAQGQAKQVESQAQHAKEDIKDNIKKAVD
uniref:CsbD family protein n=1 Tax=Trichocoleus desertorum TaxID=1481672 RepID=UPI0025B5454A|nr:CsbD family protein [Trichocoleus desertorum]